MSVAGDGAEAKAAVCRFFEERASSLIFCAAVAPAFFLAWRLSDCKASLRQKTQIEIWYHGMELRVLFNLNKCWCILESRYCREALPVLLGINGRRRRRQEKFV